ncbi:MAG: SIR2 family NAD-dependent protein deacylase [Desulfatibacillaceae bacterium]
MEDLIHRAVEDIAAAREVVALTGAGISVESGIPPFRGKGGVWERFDPMEYATIDAFLGDPAKVWDVLLREMKSIIDTARPNPAHLGLARLERLGRLAAVITQNVDGLHQKAGNRQVIEFHGNFAWQYCLKCSERFTTQEVSLDEVPPKCRCGGILRPDCVFFGEAVPVDAMSRSASLARSCDVMLVVGTSAVVEPCASMARIAKSEGARVVEINLEPSRLTGHVSDYALLGQAGDILHRIAEAVARRLGEGD